MPWILKLKSEWSFLRKYIRGARRFNEVTKQISDERLAHKKSPECDDVVATLLKAEEPESGKGLTVPEILSETGLLVFAGRHPTSPTAFKVAKRILKARIPQESELPARCFIVYTTHTRWSSFGQRSVIHSSVSTRSRSDPNCNLADIFTPVSMKHFAYLHLLEASCLVKRFPAAFTSIITTSLPVPRLDPRYTLCITQNAISQMPSRSDLRVGSSVETSRIQMSRELSLLLLPLAMDPEPALGDRLRMLR